MKNSIKNLSIVFLIAMGFSCADEALDPLQREKVKKGTLLALRGSQLEAIYFGGEAYGAAFFANDIRGNETFDYDAEFLSEDPNSLESFDTYVIKRVQNIKLNEKTNKNDTTYSNGSRVLFSNTPFSQFKKTEDYKGPWVSVSIKLTDVLSKIEEAPDPNDKEAFKKFSRAYAEGIQIEIDLNLVGGVKVLSADLVATGLYESDQFYPAQRLLYGVEDINGAKPAATVTLRGQYAVVSGKVVRTITPLKSGAKDTLDIVFNQSIDTPPTINVVPANAGTIGDLVPIPKTDNKFYVVFEAGNSYTGNAIINIIDATSDEAPPLAGLKQLPAKGIIGVDNLAPQNISFSTGTRLGKGQSATITLRFNEPLGAAPTISFVDIGNTKIDAVTDVKTVLSADKFTATYVYDYKDLDNDAVHGNVDVTVAGGKDVAGNALNPITSKTLTIDLGAAPASSIVLDPTKFDWGTQIKWTINYATGASNPNGSTSGTVYYIAQLIPTDPGAELPPVPTGFRAGDEPAFTIDDPESTTNPKQKKDVIGDQFGSVILAPSPGGTSGSVFSTFAPNGNFNVYVVFVSSSGVISAISAPTSVTME
jgi:hypothetical protein